MNPAIETMLTRFRSAKESGEAYQEVEQATRMQVDAMTDDELRAILPELQALAGGILPSTPLPADSDLSQSDVVFLRRVFMYTAGVIDPGLHERLREVGHQAAQDFAATQASVYRSAAEQRTVYTKPAPSTGLGWIAFVIGLAVTAIIVLAIISLIAKAF